jgi:hypothetical protein
MQRYLMFYLLPIMTMLILRKRICVRTDTMPQTHFWLCFRIKNVFFFKNKIQKYKNNQKLLFYLLFRIKLYIYMSITDKILRISIKFLKITVITHLEAHPFLKL